MFILAVWNSVDCLSLGQTAPDLELLLVWELGLINMQSSITD